jgi:hypothetical protein
LAEVLLYIVVAVGLAVSYLPWVTCYRHYLVFLSTTVVVISGPEVVVVVVAVAEALALRVPALAGEGPLLLARTLLGLIFLVQSATA